MTIQYTAPAYKVQSESALSAGQTLPDDQKLTVSTTKKRINKTRKWHRAKHQRVIARAQAAIAAGLQTHTCIDPNGGLVSLCTREHSTCDALLVDNGEVAYTRKRQVLKHLRAQRRRIEEAHMTLLKR